MPAWIVAYQLAAPEAGRGATSVAASTPVAAPMACAIAQSMREAPTASGVLSPRHLVRQFCRTCSRISMNWKRPAAFSASLPKDTSESAGTAVEPPLRRRVATRSARRDPVKRHAMSWPRRLAPMSLTRSSCSTFSSRPPLAKAAVLLARFTNARSRASICFFFHDAGTLSRTL